MELERTKAKREKGQEAALRHRFRPSVLSCTNHVCGIPLPETLEPKQLEPKGYGVSLE